MLTLGVADADGGLRGRQVGDVIDIGAVAASNSQLDFEEIELFGIFSEAGGRHANLPAVISGDAIGGRSGAAGTFSFSFAFAHALARADRGAAVDRIEVWRLG